MAPSVNLHVQRGCLRNVCSPEIPPAGPALQSRKGGHRSDELRIFDLHLAQTHLLAKLLGAGLVDAIRTQRRTFPHRR
jgi:hypothetical protein